MPDHCTHRVSGRSRLLGAFVLFQAIYLPLSNLMQLVPRELPPQQGELDIRVQREGTATKIRPLQFAIDGLGTAIDRYGELSGQLQAWSMFAPDFGKQSIFLMVEYACVEGAIVKRTTLAPMHLPNDPANYFRWPGFISRLCGYDYLLAAIYAQYSEQSSRERGEDWRQAVHDRVRQQQRSLEAYCRFSLNLFREQRPDWPSPREIILKVMIFPSPPPGQTTRPEPLVIPLARWLPEKAPNHGFLPVEAYDPVTREFVRLPVQERGR